MPRRSVPAPSLLFALSLALPLQFLGPPARAQAPASSQANVPTYQANARDVVVDVVVTKDKDEPVLGLQKQDFAITEDGKAQTIDYFEEHTPTAVPPGAAPPPSLPPHVYTNVPPAPPSDSVNVLLLDALNTDREDQSYVHQQIMKFLKNMQPGTRAAIFTLSSRLRMVQGFTTDSSALVAALNDPKFGDFITKPPESQSMQDKKDNVWALEKAQMMSTTPMGSIAWGVMQLADFQRDLADQQNADRIDMTLQALRILARYLDGVPNRKNLIWFSSNFPVTVFPRGTARPDQMTTTDLRDYGKAIRETADLLTVARVALYPVGAQGVISEHIQDADIESNRPGPMDYESGAAPAAPGTKTNYTAPYTSENGAHADKIIAMSQLAQDTGGKAFYNTNDLNTATQKAIANGDHYYTLVYSPTDKKMDGSYRHIAVKVSGGKYQLAYRRGYNADPLPAIVEAADSDPLHPLLAMGMPDATQLLYRVRVLPATSQPAAGAPHAGKNVNLTGPVTRYSVDFSVPSKDLQLETANGRHGGKIDLQLLAYDRDGHAVNWAGGTLVMNMSPDVYAQIQRSGIPAHFDIDLPANQEIDLETGVYDPANGKAGTLSIPIRPIPTTTASTAQPGNEH